jgi:hypothetical protein
MKTMPKRDIYDRELLDHIALKQLYRDSIFEFFSRTKYVNGLLLRFRKLGIYSIGDLISYNEHDLYRAVGVSPASRKRIRAALNECGLDFAGNEPPSLQPAIRNIDRKLGFPQL